MGYSKKSPITEFQKKVLEEYYSNGLDAIAAYSSAKGIQEPKSKNERMNASSQVSHIKKANPDYIAKLEAKNEEQFGSMKDKLIGQLEEVSSTFKKMMELALQDELTDLETQKFNRLRSMMSTRDLNKATELLAKMTGSFDSEKKEITHTYSVDWGEAPQLQESNKGIIDVEHTEE